MRKYQPAWEKLKKDGKLTIVAPVIVHPRIIKAIIKEKWNDAAFKLCNTHDYFWITHTADSKDPKKITFKLNQRLGLEGVKDEPQ